MAGNKRCNHSGLARVRGERKSVRARPEDHSYVTEERPNGKYWKTLSEKDRSALTTGLMHGIKAMGSMLAGFGEHEVIGEQVSRLEAELLPSPSISVGEIIQQMDQLYAAPAHVLLPVPEVYQIAIMILNGAPAEQREAALAEARKHYSG